MVPLLLLLVLGTDAALPLLLPKLFLELLVLPSLLLKLLLPPTGLSGRMTTCCWLPLLLPVLPAALGGGVDVRGAWR